MGNIALLDELTINKIAAGEVIERPASVIKEMIENSIDAKATKITVEIQNGGISYIKITDNGKGIAKDDLEIAFERHATSKIRCAEDLNTVTSMGFRGEALASIAAIANVELISKTQEQETGYKIIVEGGKILEKQEVGCQTGTTITVQNLFYNTPVRYKFLKKDYTETGYIEDVVTRIALVNPDISFKLINSGRTILQTAGNGDLKSVIYNIYGRDVAQGVIEVNYTYEDMRIKGVIGKPEIARSNRSNQLYFVNKRYVKDKILTAATEQAYKGTIDAGKYAFVVLNLEMPQNKVDVNVHPAKLEVRFQEESKIFQAIFHAIKDSMAKNIAQNDTVAQMDNVIIQSSSNFASKHEKITTADTVEEKPKTSGIFGWRKNRNDKNFGNNNIIEDLYNKKKVEENTDDVINTSDVLKELKQINENVKNSIIAEKEEPKPKALICNTEPVGEEEEKNEPKQSEESKNLPDGTTYTYVGENKEKIEDLLRQLHPETYKPKEPIVSEEKNENVIEFTNNYTLVENKEENTEYNTEDFEVFSVAENPEGYELNNSQNVEIEDDSQIERFVPMIFEKEEQEEKENPKEQEEIEENEEVKEINLEEEKNEEINFGENIQNFDKTQEINITEKTQKFDIIKENKQEEVSSEFSKMYEKLFGTSVSKPKTQEEKEQEKINAVDIIKDNISVFEAIQKYQKPTYKFIGIVFESYVIVEIEKEMYIINMRTAEEKIMYEKLKSNYYNRTNKDSQMLLLPDILELTDKEIEVLKENSVMLATAGFALEEFGQNTIKLTGVPTVCMDLDTKNLLIEIIEAINTVARTSIQEKEEKFLSTVASKIAQKINLPEEIQAIDALMEELLSLPNPFKYNFDKPIAIKMTKYDIERKFSRK